MEVLKQTSHLLFPCMISFRIQLLEYEVQQITDTREMIIRVSKNWTIGFMTSIHAIEDAPETRSVATSCKQHKMT